MTSLLQTPGLLRVSHVRHGFTTRSGGVSEGPWGALTLAARPEVGPEELVRNWEIALDALGGPGPERVASMSQVHGAHVVRVAEPTGPHATIGEADGAWTTEPDLVLAVRTADCVPVLLAAPGAIGVAHSGWRGTVAGVVPATVRAMCEGGGFAPDRIVAAIGPCISGEAYEVGPEVVEALRSAGLDDADFLCATDGPRPHVDVGRAVEAQLRAAGVVQIERIERCTLRDRELHSYRRDGTSSGRLAGLIVREAL